MFLWRFFSSVRLTLALLLGMAIAAIPGTVIRPEAGRYELFYQTPWFRALLVLLSLNLLVCTLRTIRRNLHDAKRFHEQLAAPPQSARALAGDSIEPMRAVLARFGFRGDLTGNRFWGCRGRLGRWGSTLVHVSLLAIMFGAVLGERGFVGTINTYLHDENTTYFDWDSESEKALGFSLRVDNFRLHYYPITLRFELVDPVEGQLITKFTGLEGESIEIAKGLWRVEVRHFNPDDRVLTLGIFRNGSFVGDYLIDEKGERFGDKANPGFRARNIEFRDPVLKQMSSDVSILEGGQVVRQGTIKVNEPLTWQGVSIYQTAYGRDKNGYWTTGFQLSQDPGEGIVWVAAVVLCCGLAAAFLEVGS